MSLCFRKFKMYRCVKLTSLNVVQALGIVGLLLAHGNQHFSSTVRCTDITLHLITLQTLHSLQNLQRLHNRNRSHVRQATPLCYLVPTTTPYKFIYRLWNHNFIRSKDVLWRFLKFSNRLRDLTTTLKYTEETIIYMAAIRYFEFAKFNFLKFVT